MTPTHSTSPSTTRRIRWLLALPKLGIVLLLVALVSLLWLLHRNEIEEDRAALIKDVLWLEQSLQFHLNSNEEQIQQLALDMASLPDRRKAFRLRAEHMLKNSPEVAQILWLDSERKVVDALPSSVPPEQEIETFGPSAASRAHDLVMQLGKTHYSEPFFLGSNRAHIELIVPIHGDDQHIAGTLVVLYPLETLLANQVPWWFTEKYKVEIIDDNDQLYASKTRIEGNGDQRYVIPFDPPGSGLLLRVTSYRSADNSVQRSLVAAIILLAAGVFWSLWLVRDLMKKRSRAEEALRSEHAFRAAMEDSLTVGMRARDLNGCVIYVNPAFCKMTGFSPEELVGATPPMP